MKTQIKFFLFLVAVAALFPPRAHAYLDPGTGSYVIQVLAAVFFGGFFVIKTWWTQIKHFVTNLLGGKDKKSSEKSDSK
jgi:hypothetical protein